MTNWKRHIIVAKGFPVKIYLNNTNNQVYVFPLFGKYFKLYSSANTLDFITGFLLSNQYNEISFQAYVNSQEDTVAIQIEKIAI